MTQQLLLSPVARAFHLMHFTPTQDKGERRTKGESQF
jgi:hypothetical protein